MVLNCWHPGFQLDHSCKCKHAVFITGTLCCSNRNFKMGNLGRVSWYTVCFSWRSYHSAPVKILNFIIIFGLPSQVCEEGDEAGGRKCWLQLKKASGQVRLAKKDCSMKLFSVCAYSRHASRLPSSCIFSNKNGMFYLLEQVSVVYKELSCSTCSDVLWRVSSRANIML